MKSFVEGGGGRRESMYKGSEPVVLNTGPLGARVYWGIETGEAKGPEPKSIQLHRVETLGQTFSALPILTFYYGDALAAGNCRTSLSFPQLHIHHILLKPLSC
jgi:hypothetical protein